MGERVCERKNAKLITGTENDQRGEREETRSCVHNER